MRIVIDLQGAQAESRFRGIGRYSLSIAKGIVRNHNGHEIIIALSGLFPNTIQPIRDAFEGLLPQENICVWYAPGPVCALIAGNTWRRKSAELVREAFLASLNPDVVLICSLFEGLVDDAVTSISQLSNLIPTAVVLYDLIPLVHRKLYLNNPDVIKWYEGKITQLRSAALLLSISDSSRQEGIQYLGLSQEQITNISTAADPQFYKRSFSDAEVMELKQRYALKSNYVMYTGGIDHRKNIESLIGAFARLPCVLRKQHQLVIVCSIQDADRIRLESLAKKKGLATDELVLTGFVPEEDLVVLYNLCTAFIFPSKHEGFGLPVLEAMQCGCVVIASNTSSLPEVIGCKEALFDPHDEASIVAKLEQALTDHSFRQRLKQHALIQVRNFSWDKSAKRALSALEAFNKRNELTKSISGKREKRPRLAYISPLPPERSGISDYSAELLPELARYYEIEVVVAQESISNVWIKANCQMRTIDWFRAHADGYDRVLYHFGNSVFHQHMFELLTQFPGVLVLHDFFLSGISADMEIQRFAPDRWIKELYHSHGYQAVQHRCTTKDIIDVVMKYPCNLSVLQNAQGIIVHSEFSRRLAKFWYGSTAANEWAQIQHLRVPIVSTNKHESRKAQGIAESEFVVCSFGMLGRTKLNHRLLDAWINSALAKDRRCRLVFVGSNEESNSGQELIKKIRQSGLKKRIQITGWADTEVFRHYLAAADLAVQLRTLSRGETSGTVLDCMNYGLATIVNANGSMADLPKQCVLQLTDNFSDDELTTALESLWQDADQRQRLGEQAQQFIRTVHAPKKCANQYFNAIESFYSNALNPLPVLIKNIAQLESPPIESEAWKKLAYAIDVSVAPVPSQRQLFVDVSELNQDDVTTGVQGVVRALLRELLLNPPSGYFVEPVYVTADFDNYYYARHFALELLGCPTGMLRDEPISYRAGDVFLGLDQSRDTIPRQSDFYQQMRRYGVVVKFKKDLERWLNVVTKSDGTRWISKVLEDELQQA